MASKQDSFINFLHKMREYNGKTKIAQPFFISVSNKQDFARSQRQFCQTGSTGQGKSGRQPTSTGDSFGA